MDPGSKLPNHETYQFRIVRSYKIHFSKTISTRTEVVLHVALSNSLVPKVVQIMTKCMIFYIMKF